jgi:hypothetical protein
LINLYSGFQQKGAGLYNSLEQERSRFTRHMTRGFYFFSPTLRVFGLHKPAVQPDSPEALKHWKNSSFLQQTAVY